MYKIKVYLAGDTENFESFTHVDNHEFAVIFSDIITNSKWIVFPLSDSAKEKHPDDKIPSDLHTAFKKDDIKAISIELK